DIETEGLSKEKNEITIIGICKDGKYYPFIKGFNLNKALNYLAFTPIWITFGGENFDIPFIKKTFPNLETPLVHIDLFFLAKELGLKGGLKKIEKSLGIIRKTEGLNGYDAVKLWRKWTEEKDKNALRKLLLYNKEDVINLKKIMDYVIKKFLERREETYEKIFERTL
ncbi:MAG: ribonuclease H-like domain-containing protein, partial [Thermodesulfobacterium sp.]|nr:ribonuclease H-like domain-containing protein [Thermodesulfobacterium sp.]